MAEQAHTALLEAASALVASSTKATTDKAFVSSLALAELASVIANGDQAAALRPCEILLEALRHIADPEMMRGEWIGDEMVYRWIGAEHFQDIARAALPKATGGAQ